MPAPKKSMDRVKRAHRITKEVDVKFDNFYIIGGYRFPNERGVQAENVLKFKYLGKIEVDKTLDEYVLDGKSLLELPSDNVAFASVKKIMKTVGYL